ncbi:hypothetical protein OAB00_01490 [Akkermansiaceae bacterium]|nr:hypothetical protein [Akkermansiaceae bacterium]
MKVLDVSKDETISLVTDGDTVVRYANPENPKEYFLIEAKNKNTLGNSALKSEKGLLIWHVDESNGASNTKPQMTTESHYAHSIEQADGKFDLELQGPKSDAGDLYGIGDAFTNQSKPSSKWWSGEASGLSITEIKFLDQEDKISFKVSAN